MQFSSSKRRKYKRYRRRGSHARGVYICHTGYLSHRNNNDERERSRHKNNSKIARNLEKMNVGTKRKNHKRRLTSA